MQIEEKVFDDLLIPRKILESVGITGRAQIIMKAGELRIVQYQRKTIVVGMKGLGKNIQPEKSSVELVRELRAEWKMSG
ncbi:hypothetical protein C5S39_12355 [Candidatus Methanophagaceae archaeon]|nr:hypothetical protein C5S39_12355 [Methanophagales archaeon]